MHVGAQSPFRVNPGARLCASICKAGFPTATYSYVHLSADQQQGKHPLNPGDPL